MATNFLPNLKFLPDRQPGLNSSSKLAEGVSIGNFVQFSLFNKLPPDRRLTIARNLLPQAQLLAGINRSFPEYNLEVVEGFNTAAEGRSVAYAITGRGYDAVVRTYDLAKLLFIYHPFFDKLILDYDSYTGGGELSAQLLIETPAIPPSYAVRFKRGLETRYNNEVLAGQLIRVAEGAGGNDSLPPRYQSEVFTESGSTVSDPQLESAIPQDAYQRQRTIAALQGVNDRLVRVVTRALELSPQRFSVTEGLRSQARQAQLVAAGRSQTLESKHIRGLAVDLFPENSYTQELYYPIFNAMRTAAREQGVAIRWGGAWTVKDIRDWRGTAQGAIGSYVSQRRQQNRSPFVDSPHFELA